MAVTVAAVKAMIPEIDPAMDIQWAVDDATNLMAAPFAAAKPPVLTTIQDIVVKYLAAHFVTVNIEYGGLLRQRIGESDESYSGSRVNTGLSLTRYGQQAIALDPTRALAQMDNASGGVAQIRMA